MICMFKMIHFCLEVFFEKFRDKCIEIYGIDPSYFYSAPGLAWQTCLKKVNVKLKLLTDYQMLLMIEEGIRGGMRQSVHRYAKANNKYMKNYDKKVIISNIFRCKQFIWMGNVSKITCKWVYVV